MSSDKKLKKVRGKFIAIVYSFEGENAPGFQHYDVWRADVISDWLNAIQEVGCIPYILDVRTFVYKAANNSLPHIDFVINLNAGNFELSTLGLVPSVCGFLAIPCIPCDTISSVVGESKILSNLIAFAAGLNVPKELNISDLNGIFKPNNLGSSCGIKKGHQTTEKKDYVYQQFIEGFDVTIPILHNPNTKKLEVLPAILYLPESKDPNWFLGEKEKWLHTGYKKHAVLVDEETKEKCLELGKAYSIKTFYRVDTRLACNSYEELLRAIKEPIHFSKVYFLEINAMPTIKQGINFHNSLEHLNSNHPMYGCLASYKKEIKNHTLTGFILYCALSALT